MKKYTGVFAKRIMDKYELEQMLSLGGKGQVRKHMEGYLHEADPSSVPAPHMMP